MKITFEYNDLSTKEIVIDSELIELVANIFRYGANPADLGTTKDKFIAQKMRADWRVRIANKVRENHIAGQETAISTAINDMIDPLSEDD